MSKLLNELKSLNRNITDIRAAVQDRGGVVPKRLKEVGDAIRALPMDGGGSRDLKDINFFDYDGRLVHSYTVEEASRLTALPDLPYHTGLTPQCWTHTLSEVKTLKRLNIAPCYVTDDGKTRFYLRFEDDKALDLSFKFTQTVENGIEIDWGDGSAAETFSGVGAIVAPHTYAPESYPFECVMTLERKSGSFTLASKNNDFTFGTCAAHNNHVMKLELGAGITEIGDYGIRKFYRMETLTIPKEVQTWSDSSLQYLYAAKFLYVPRGMSKLYFNMSYCPGLIRAVIPETVKELRLHCFYGDHSLHDVILPEALTYLDGWSFESSFAKVVLPPKLTHIGDHAFRSNCAIEEIVVPDTVTTMYSEQFYRCEALRKLTLSNSLTKIYEKMCAYCVSLEEVRLPKDITEIPSECFQSCASLKYIKIPPKVTNIASYAFSNCTSMKEYDFSECEAIPTLGTSVFYGIPATCVIKVPAALYDEWIAAKGWTTFAEKIVAA